MERRRNLFALFDDNGISYLGILSVQYAIGVHVSFCRIQFAVGESVRSVKEQQGVQPNRFAIRIALVELQPFG